MVRVLAYFFREDSPDAPTILDVGCGPGTFSTRILDSFPQGNGIGVDVSPEMIESAKRNLVPRFGTRFSVYVSDFNSDKFWIPSIDVEYDSIVSSIALHRGFHNASHPRGS